MNKKPYLAPLTEAFQLEAANGICQTSSMSTEDIIPSNPIDWGWSNIETIF